MVVVGGSQSTCKYGVLVSRGKISTGASLGWFFHSRSNVTRIHRDGGYFPGSYLEIRQVEASMNRMGGGIVVVWAHILTVT